MTITSAIDALASFLGDRLSLSKSDLEMHGASETHFAAAPPDAVAYPVDTKEVSQIVKTCTDHDCPVIPYGAGTALEGHTLAVRGGVTIDLSKMTKILAVNAEDMDVVIQPGLTREDLNTELRATGLFFPVDPGANASLGGMASTRASGTTAVRYGTMRDNVLALEVVLADGRIIRTGSRARKSSSGYDLTALFVGAEGTLGVITELTLRLQGQPEAVSSAVCSFDDIGDAVAAVIATIQMGIPMARIEFIDAETTRACNAYSNADMPEVPHLMVEFHGSDAGVAEQATRFGEIVEEMGGTGFKWSSKAEERTALWDMRHKAYYACLALRKGATAVVTDVCVPISRLAEAVEASRKDIDASGLIGPILGHVGDGNYHAILLVEPGNAAEMQTAKGLSNRMVERALAMGGTATGEHGIGIGKLDYMRDEHGEAWDVMAEIKCALDPKSILNPAKVVLLD
ncbi:2-hydroxy-acid oxidase [Marinosulfonomonas sp. PRT-SC04]|nr:2-hydroxy-acid oxidase [Marinosulfonomonas sp. PRT-SC04]